MIQISIKTSREVQFIDITSEVERVVRESGVKEGAANIFTKHTTTAIIINENEPGLLRDYEKLVELVPKGRGYEHDRIDDNAHSHLRSILLGPNKVVPIIEGSLALGTWQRIFLAEFDGPRVREVVVQVIG
ncbi:MAG: secondary thiamine-phosphate synthase enzyme YjbQ [Candidatus Hydrothermarchaeota archaeon]|nr:secondary thiamine-phosphate synthase enzyme YjbQ [Candidatus Hydrothermarchaeota archaeon]